MKKIKDLFKSFIAVLIVMLGSYLTNFYLTHEFSFTGILIGSIGFIILFPAVKKWEEVLWGSEKNEK
jgi:hypothetical protein